MQSKLIKKGHQMGDILENENISAYYSMKYSDEEVLLLDDAKLLAKPNPLRVGDEYPGALYTGHGAICDER